MCMYMDIDINIIYIGTVVFLGLQHYFCKSFGGICCLLVILVKICLFLICVVSATLAQ